MSVSRAVTMPSKGAIRRLKLSIGDQPVDIGLRRLDLGDIGIPGESALVDVLLGDGVGACERLPALRGDLRELGIGLGDVQVGPRLHELLVEIGRIDFGEQLAGFHLGADVVLPGL